MTYLFGNARPAITRVSDSADVMLGLRYKMPQARLLKAIRIWRDDTAARNLAFYVWNSAGSVLRSGVIECKAGNGWNEHTLANPLRLKAGETITVGYRAVKGRYAVTQNAFAGNPRGVYKYNSNSMPTDTYKASNYWIDMDLAAVPFEPPVFVQQPQSVYAVNGKATLSAAASGSQPIQMTWQRYSLGDWVTAVGTNDVSTKGSTTLSKFAVETTSTLRLRCVASNSTGVCASQVAEIKPELPQPPRIVSQPADTTIALGSSNIKFTIVALDALTYSWRELINGQWVLLDINSATFEIPIVNEKDDGRIFSCAISNAAGTTFSNSFKISISKPVSDSHGRDINFENTGARIQGPLQVQNATVYASKAPNGVYEGLDLRGGIVIDAPVSLYNCFVHGTIENYPAMYYVELRWCTIRPDSVQDYAIGSENYYAYRCQLLNCSDGARANGGFHGVFLEECLIRCASQSNADHNDGVQCYQANGNVSIVGCNIDISNLNNVGANAAFMAADNSKGKATIMDNWLAGGAITLRLYEDMEYDVQNNEILAGSFQYADLAIYNPNNRPIVFKNNVLVDADGNPVVSIP